MVVDRRSEVRDWLDSGIRSEEAIDWSWFKAIYGFEPPSDFCGFVESCGYGTLGNQWEIGVAIPDNADEVGDCIREASLDDWLEPHPEDLPDFLAFAAEVRRLCPFVFANDAWHEPRFVAWRRTEQAPESWAVIMIDFAERRVEDLGSCFREFVSRWADGDSPNALQTPMECVEAFDWRPNDHGRLRGRISQCIKNLDAGFFRGT